MARIHPARETVAESLTAKIVEAVADREGVEPTALPPLHDAVDPDAVEAIFAPTSGDRERTSGRVEFHYCGYEVVVHSDGRVAVGDPEDQ